MKNDTENSERIRARILALIGSAYESDSAFERDMGLAGKTVNNWRRGRSSSYMRMLPLLAEKFGVSVGALLDAPLRSDSSELSDDELRLLQAYRRAQVLSPQHREALCDTLERVVDLYVQTAGELRHASSERSKTARTSRKPSDK